MGRPRKDQADAIPTREKILAAACVLFAERGFDAVSIRDITRSLGLNEASLYNHFRGKQELMDAILVRLEEQLLKPAFAPLPPQAFSADHLRVGSDETYKGAADGLEYLSLADFLIQGARRFFARADSQTLLTWRILMMGQYRYPAARDMVAKNLLDGPVPFFQQIIEAFKAAGRVSGEVDSHSAARIIAALFFDFSFRSNLMAAWQQEDERLFDRLELDLRLAVRSFEKAPTPPKAD